MILNNKNNLWKTTLWKKTLWVKLILIIKKLIEMFF
jgi:hypothetical protein